MKSKSISIILLAFATLAFWPAQADYLDQFVFDFEQADEPDFWANCSAHQQPLDSLQDDCRILKLFNQAQVDDWNLEDQLKGRRPRDWRSQGLAKHCACQLLHLDSLWSYSLNVPETSRLASIVYKTFSRNNGTYRPNYMWTNLDVIVRRVSISVATQDFFIKLSENKAMTPSERRRYSKDEMWQLTKKVCRPIATDTHGLYRYMENLGRLNPVVFLALTYKSQIIDRIYQASKACKVLLMLRFNEYKIYPTDPNLIPVVVLATNQKQRSSSNASSLKLQQDASDNTISNELDINLKDAAVGLLRCERLFASHELTMIDNLDELRQECPIMISERVPVDWLLANGDPQVRNDYALKCGCQLLRHKPTWAKILEDPNVKLMSKALTNFLSRQSVPEMQFTPIWSISGWFEHSMEELTNNRKKIIKELQMARNNELDLTSSFRLIEHEALEMLRRGCNYIVFNYNKGKKESVELKLIRYLDNLSQVSQDPMFVFSLALQDPNLFKLYALSKMCHPIVY